MIQKIKALFKSRIFWENLIIILVALIIYIGFRVTIQNYFVQGPSMEPNYWQNERIWVNKLEYKFGAPQTGDIIVFQPPIQSSKPFIKRIIGMPGETVEIKNGVGIRVTEVDDDALDHRPFRRRLLPVVIILAGKNQHADRLGST